MKRGRSAYSGGTGRVGVVSVSEGTRPGSDLDVSRFQSVLCNTRFDCDSCNGEQSLFGQNPPVTCARLAALSGSQPPDGRQICCDHPLTIAETKAPCPGTAHLQLRAASRPRKRTPSNVDCMRLLDIISHPLDDELAIKSTA